MRDAEELAREIARALSELMAAQERIRVPGRLRPAHKQLTHALRDEFVAMSAYHAAALGSDVGTVRSAALAYEHAEQARRGQLRAIGLRIADPGGEASPVSASSEPQRSAA
jgi:hypothetical protein